MVQKPLSASTETAALELLRSALDRMQRMYSKHAADAEAAVGPGGIMDSSFREQEALTVAGAAAIASTGVGATLEELGAQSAVKGDSCFLRHCRTWVEGQSRAIASAMREVDGEVLRCSRTTK